MDYLLFLSNSLDHLDNNLDPIFVSFHNTYVKSISEQLLMLFFLFIGQLVKTLVLAVHRGPNRASVAKIQLICLITAADRAVSES